jgi:hypothetical protein
MAEVFNETEMTGNAMMTLPASSNEVFFCDTI